MKRKRKNIILLAISLIFITFVTIFSRTPSLSRVAHMVPLWSYIPLLSGKLNNARQILLNVALFIPFGYFLRTLIKSRWAILVALFTSVSIELIQFLTYRGMLDCDDLISNTLGSAIGVLIWSVIDKHGEWAHHAARIAMLFAGFVGCLMVAVPATEQTISSNVTRQFWIDLTSVSNAENGEGGNIIYLDGQCFTYDRQTPSYTLLLGDEELSTYIDGECFSATISKNIEKKEELQIPSQAILLCPQEFGWGRMAA